MKRVLSALGRRIPFKAIVIAVSTAAIPAAIALLIAASLGSDIASNGVARVDGQSIHRDAVFYFEAEQQTGSNPLLTKGSGVSLHGGQIVGNDHLTTQSKQQIAAVLVQNIQLKAYGDKTGIVVTPKQVTAYYHKTIKSNWKGKEKNFTAFFAKRGLDKSQVMALMRQDLIIKGVLTREQKKIKVTKAEAQAYWNAHQSSFFHPELRRVQLLTVKTQAEAQSLRDQVEAGSSFTQIIKKDSLDSTGASGGIITVEKTTTLKGFYPQIHDLAVGTLSEPFHTKLGWHVVKALAPVLPAGVWPFKQVQQEIMNYLLQQKSGSASQTFFAKLAKLYPARFVKGYAPPTNTKPTLVAGMAWTTGLWTALIVFLISLLTVAMIRKGRKSEAVTSKEPQLSESQPEESQ